MKAPAATLDRLVARAGQLYSLPTVAVKVLELTNNPQVDTRALKECIENDPALTAKLLRVVNSSLFGLSREVSDLNQALALLGTKPLKMLVLGFSLPAGLFAGVTGEVLGWYWRHALTKAVAGRELSEGLFHTPGDEAFIAGLLQDLGILLLIREFGGPYAKLLEKVRAAGKDLGRVETESLGFDHTTLSARLLGHWGLPESLVEAVKWEAAQRGTKEPLPLDRPLPLILHLAELMARLLADGQPAALRQLLETGRAHGDFSRPQLESLVQTLEEKVRQLADVLSLNLPAGVEYRDVLVAAHAQLAAVADETAAGLVRQRQAGAGAEEDSLLAEVQCLSAAAAKLAPQPKEPAAAVAAAGAQPPGVRGKTGTGSDEPRLNPRVWRSGEVQVAGFQHNAGPAAVSADPGLLSRLTAAAAACRRSRSALSLLLVQFDAADALAASGGTEGFRRLRVFLEALCKGIDHPGAVCAAHSAAGFAVVLPDCERRLAVQWGNQLIARMDHIPATSRGKERQAVRIAVGVATVALPPKNFVAEDLFTTADRCLYGSHASGGGVVKSIEI